MMKAIVFAYHDIGCAGLKALTEAGYDVQVFIHTDDPGENNFFSSVARLGAGGSAGLCAGRREPPAVG